MTLIDTYLEEQDKYTRQFGDNTILLMEVGSFFEIYGIDGRNDSSMHKIAQLLNLHISRKNGKGIDISVKNPLMAGFPNYTVEKYIRILLKHDYTIVLMEQESHGSKNPTRSISRIYSPGTDVEYDDTLSNSLVSFHIETFPSLHSNERNFLCGVSVFDVTTGKSSVIEFSVSYKKNIEFAVSHLEERLHALRPNEIIWTTHALSSDGVDVQKIKKMLEKFFCSNHCVPYEAIQRKREHILSKVFDNNSSHSILHFLGLSRSTCGCSSFVHLLTFVETHNANALVKMKRPIVEMFEGMDRLHLTNTTLHQLNLISTSEKTYASVYSVVNKCSTAFGKRRLFHRLTHPICSRNRLKARYDDIARFMGKLQIEQNKNTKMNNIMYTKKNKKRYIWELCERHLKDIVDIERGHRRLTIGTLHPSECASFCLSFESIVSIIELMDKIEHMRPFPYAEDLHTFIRNFSNTFDLCKLSRYSLDTIDEQFFNEGIFPDIDDVQSQVSEYRKELEVWRQTYSDFIDSKKSCVRLMTNERDGWYLSVTKKRFEILQSFTGNQAVPPVSSFTIQRCKNEVKLRKGPIGALSEKLKEESSRMVTMVREKYLDTLCSWNEKYRALFEATIDYISNIDIATSGAKCALLLNYNRPVFSEESLNDSSSSMVQFKEVRHPLIERIHDDVPYIANDISLGTKDTLAMLLYGVNASGKSSLMKAVGINVILAQAGLFVAAKEMTFNPYTHIFTRLTKNDDLYRGQSSFAVEMSELRDILLRSNEKSLVLGDELCSGTESISALSIVSSGIKCLYKKGASFLFATHLHELHHLPVLKPLERLQKYHLSVSYEPSTNRLIYDRKLLRGVGSTLYGLEVCKGMDMPKEFIELANTIRTSIMGKTTTVESSSYNCKVIKDECAICGEKARDTHHIQFQSDANELEMIGSIHKNRKSNLVALCQICHNAVHHGSLTIHGYIQTSHGISLNYEWNEKEKEGKKRRKIDSHHVSWLCHVKNSDISLELLKKLFYKEFEVHLSTATISKVRRGLY